MSDKDIGKLYCSILEGNEYRSRPKLTEMYGSVIVKESNDIQPTNPGDAACGNSESTIKYKDPDSGQWRCARASDKWIEDILKPALGIADSASYLSKILNHGRVTGVFDGSMNIGHPTVLAFYEWLNDSVSRGTLAQVINKLPSITLQNAIINTFEDSSVSTFNYYDLLNDTINNEVPGAAAGFQEDPKLTIIRPAGDEGATRGAAGPGEALLAFMFNGSKPTVGDLVFHEINKAGEQTNKIRYVVELKKNKGRIGKGINKNDVKDLSALFHGFNAPGDAFHKTKAQMGQMKSRGIAGTLKGLTWEDELDPESGYSLEDKFAKEWNGKSMYDFLAKYSGVGNSRVDDSDKQTFSHGIYADCVGWFGENAGRMSRQQGGDSAYNQIVQWIGGIHIKDYFRQVAEFDSIAVFLQNGTIASFPRNTILSLSAPGIIQLLQSKNCFFGPRTDEGGFDIQIRGASARDNETI